MRGLSTWIIIVLFGLAVISLAASKWLEDAADTAAEIIGSHSGIGKAVIPAHLDAKEIREKARQHKR